MNIRPHLKFLGICILVVLGSLSILATGGGSGGSGGGGGAPNNTFGVVAFNAGGIGVIDGNTRSVSYPLLVGELGSSGGGRFDVAITPDGLTTLVSNFGDSKVFFIDTTKPSSPSVIGEVDVTFFAEDIAITPSGRFALVTDGGFSPVIAVIDIPTRTLVEVYDSTPTPDLGVAPTVAETPCFQTDGLGTNGPSDVPSALPVPQFQSIAIAPDGQTVLAADYWNAMIHVLTMDFASGHLTYVGGFDVYELVDGNISLRPVNVTISPNGRTALAAAVLSVNDPDPPNQPLFEYMGFPVLNINGPGDVTLTGILPAVQNLTGCQSVAFNPSGTKAYAHCVQEWPLPQDPDTEPNNVIVTFNVDPASGVVADAGTPMPVHFIGRSQLFGVDTMDMAPGGRYLVVSNPTISGGLTELDVLDTQSGDLTAINFSNTMVPAVDPADPPTSEPTLPIGVNFFTGQWY